MAASVSACRSVPGHLHVRKDGIDSEQQSEH